MLIRAGGKGEAIHLEKRVEFFEKEEGHLYDKIGEAIYQRKRIENVNSANAITEIQI